MFAGGACAVKRLDLAESIPERTKVHSMVFQTAFMVSLLSL